MNDMDIIMCNVCQITMHRSMYDEHMRLHQMQQTISTYDMFSGGVDFSTLLSNLARHTHQVPIDTFPHRSAPQPPSAPFYPSPSHLLLLQYSSANNASTQQAANFLHNFDTITRDIANNWQPTTNVHTNFNNSQTIIDNHTSNLDIPNYTYTQSTTTPGYRETTRVSPFADIHTIALEMLATIDDSEYYDNYEANLRLAERIGVVEVGIENVDAVSTIIQKEQVSSDDICAICLDKLFEKRDDILVRQLICGHKYCDDCISQWLIKSKKCPVCNIDLEDKLNEDEQ